MDWLIVVLAAGSPCRTTQHEPSALVKVRWLGLRMRLMTAHFTKHREPERGNRGCVASIQTGWLAKRSHNMVIVTLARIRSALHALRVLTSLCSI
jgi:hypothetical protein